MTDEELARFAHQLSEAQRVRALIAEDAAAEGDGELPPPHAIRAAEQISILAPFAA